MTTSLSLPARGKVLSLPAVLLLHYLCPKLIISICCLSFPFILSAASPHTVRFVKGTVADIQQQAGEEGKLYFIHFAADWCMPCQWMEKNVFTDERLADYIQEAYLAMSLNIDQEDGSVLKEQYQVTILPSILIFSTRGQLLGRLEGAMEAEALYEQLKQYDRPAHRAYPSLAGTQEEILPSPQPTLHISRPALIPDAERPAASTSFITSTNIPVPVDIATNRARQAYYTIQLGVFSSYDNAVRKCATLEQKLGINTQLAPMEKGGQALYKVFIGRFDTYEQASHYLSRLGSIGQEGFVKKIDI